MLVLSGLLSLIVWCQASFHSQPVTAHCDLPNLEYAVESSTASGTPCITDCINGKCLSSWNTCEYCTPGTRTAPTYYTSQYKQELPRCISNCGLFGRNTTWCFVDNTLRWDYCNPETDPETMFVQKSIHDLPCLDLCQYVDGLQRCHTSSHTLEYCDEEEIAYVQQKTRYGKRCREECKIYGSTYYQCWDEDNVKEICAPSAEYQDTKQRVTRALADKPNKNVLEYAAIMKLKRSTMETTVNDRNNPIKKYYYTVSGNAKLPLIVEAEISRHHIRPAGTRTQGSISTAARTNCERMGMNKNLPNHNNDQVGHFVSWKNGGPPDWYNFAPQTQRINIGTTNATVTDVVSPSLWTRTEEEITAWAEAGKTVKFTVVAVYAKNVKRPLGFGTSETYLNRDKSVNRGMSVLSYWYSNDPYADPDEWNRN
ncbi:uncharacterized protein [Choristoneura fumiferana]|uniref:uncharacterized protein n=1 Tax=Choristoneura fumiferana TaxID=7141 RepID=UPI003D155EC7